MSLAVVMNGPVAIAGSIPCLSKMIGINVPTKADIIITLIIEPATVKLKSISWLIISPKIIKTMERIKPLINAKPISLNNLLIRDPLITWFAMPWTLQQSKECRKKDF